MQLEHMHLAEGRSECKLEESEARSIWRSIRICTGMIGNAADER